MPVYRGAGESERMCSYLASLPILLKVDSKGSIEIRKADDAEKREFPKE